jgi:hypothetical protein
MIGRLLLIALAGVAGTALTAALAAPAASDAKRLTVRTGPGKTIKLTRAGSEVDYLRPGRHAITIRDTSRSHNVALTRLKATPSVPGRNRYPPKVLTSFAFVGTKTVPVALTPGLWTVSCLRHSRPGSAYHEPDQGMTDPFRVE